jgi:hypothetical protein
MSDEKRPEDGAKPPTRKQPPDAPDAEPQDSGAFFTDEEHDGWAPIRRRPPDPEES